jgi:hypothetical protein
MLSTIYRLLHTLLVHAKSNDHHWLEEPKYLADEMNPSKLSTWNCGQPESCEPSKVCHTQRWWVGVINIIATAKIENYKLHKFSKDNCKHRNHGQTIWVAEPKVES